MNFGKFLVVSFVLSVACMSQSIPSGVVGGVAVTPPTNPTGKVSRVLNVNNGYAKGVANYGQSVLMSYVGQRIITDTQHRLYAHLTRMELNFFHTLPTGNLISRFTIDINMMRVAVSNALTAFGKDFALHSIYIWSRFSRVCQLVCSDSR